MALLFYNPAAADDVAVKHELAQIPRAHGHVVTQAVPLTELRSYNAVTNEIPVNFSPTLVVVGPSHDAYEITGYTTAFEISQRVADALATR